MNIGIQTFWLYTLAACSLVWGVLGLRFAASVFAANILLAVLLFGFQSSLSDNALYALLLGYPLYWGIAFALLAPLDRLKLAAVNAAPRFLAAFLVALAFFCAAKWDDLRFAGRLLHAAFVADVNERPLLIRKAMRDASHGQVCGDSHASLMTLALDARDKDVMRVLLESFSLCEKASRTMQQVVRPLLDQGKKDEIAFLLQCGLKPSSLVFGADYANGTALAYAATATPHPEIVRLIAGHDPEDAENMRYFDMMVEALFAQGNTAMLKALADAGLLREDPAGE